MRLNTVFFTVTIVVCVTAIRIYDPCIVKTTPAVSTSTTPKTGGGDGGVGGGDDDPATSPTVGGGDGDVDPPTTPKAAGGGDEGATPEPGTSNTDDQRRKRNAEEECNLQNAVCVASNCTCQDGYTASADLTKCESSGSLSYQLLSCLWMFVIFGKMIL